METLQKKALGLILGTIYIENRRYYNINGQPFSYENALDYLNMQTLDQRREDLLQKFAVETFKNDRHIDFFEQPIETGYDTRSISKCARN